MSPDFDKVALETLQGSLSVAIAEYDRVFKRGQLIAEKAGTIAGFSGVLFALVGQWMLSSKSYSVNLMVITAISFAASGCFSVLCLFPSLTGRFPIENLSMLSTLKQASKEVLSRVISTYVETIRISDESINRGACWLKIAIGSFSAGLVCLFLGMVASI